MRAYVPAKLENPPFNPQFTATSPAHLHAEDTKAIRESNYSSEVQEGVNVKSQTFEMKNDSKASLK